MTSSSMKEASRATLSCPFSSVWQSTMHWRKLRRIWSLANICSLSWMMCMCFRSFMRSTTFWQRHSRLGLGSNSMQKRRGRGTELERGLPTWTILVQMCGIPMASTSFAPQWAMMFMCAPPPQLVSRRSPSCGKGSVGFLKLNAHGRLCSNAEALAVITG